MQKLTQYTIGIPDEVLGKIRLLSAQRKAQNHANRTQKAIIVELLEIGLFMVTPSNGEQANTGEATM